MRAQGGEGPLRIWGEDAIVAFPGAQTSIIDERDAYMARTIRAAAQGARPAPPAACRLLHWAARWQLRWRMPVTHHVCLVHKVPDAP